MKIANITTILTLAMLILILTLILVTGCAKQVSLEDIDENGEEEDSEVPAETMPAEESKLVPPDLEKGVGEVSIAGEEGTFLSRIMNMMVEELS